MAKVYYAHSDHKTKSTNWQTIYTHSTNTANLIKEFSENWCTSEYAENLGLLHDIGKYQESFQEKLNGKSIQIEHSICGAKEWIKLNFPYEGAYCIAGHHSGLPDVGSSTDSCDQPTLIGRLKRETENYTDYKKEIKTEEIIKNPAKQAIISINDTEKFLKEYAFFIRMMFSCLVDSDFLDTEKYFEGEVPRGVNADLDLCLKQINQKVKEFDQNTNIKIIRNRMRLQVLSKKEQKANIFFLNMPTGSGKTLTSMQFALSRVANNKCLKRIIYVIPFTSIIEQNAKVFKDIFGKDKILEHHSNFDFSNVTDKELKERLQRATENWDADIIVTTNVEFFQSIYGNKSSNLRKLHNIANSIIIFDEVHMMPTNFFQPCLEAVKILTTCYNCEAVFMTATMPDFEIWLKKFGCDGVKTIDLLEDKSDYHYFKRCNIKSLGNVSAERIVQQAQSQKNALIIVNSRKAARVLFEMITIKKYHLSTYMTHDDRTRVIEQVKKSLENGEKFILVSTSLIEAGVDLDCDCVFRETAGLENLLQSAGRCNREGLRNNCTTYDFEFDEDELKVSLSEVKIKQTFLRETFEKFSDVQSLEAINYYFNRLYDYTLEDMQSMDFKKAIKKVGYGKINIGFDFKSYSDEFRLINDKTQPLVILTKKNEKTVLELIEKLSFGDMTALRKLQKYTIQLRKYEYENLETMGAIVHKMGVDYLGNENLYDENVGILFEDKTNYIF